MSREQGVPCALAAGRWYFAVSALDLSGTESGKSNEASKLIQ